MSVPGFRRTAEHRVTERFEGGVTVEWTEHIALPSGALAGTDDAEVVDMHHKCLGGETPGMRSTIARMERRLVEHGNDPHYARQVAQSCAIRHDRRRERGPKR